MRPLFLPILENVPLSGSVPTDVSAFLTSHGRLSTLEHVRRVAETAGQLAVRVGEDQEAAEHAGWLHDISVVYPSTDRARIAGELGLEILPEEAALPMILHQKISALMAAEIFQVVDERVLSAIGCHTTLKPGATHLDQIVFVADKLAWDQAGNPPYLEAMQAALETSIDAASLVYLDHLWQNRYAIPVLHPWTLAARSYLIKLSTD